MTWPILDLLFDYHSQVSGHEPSSGDNAPQGSMEDQGDGGSDPIVAPRTRRQMRRDLQLQIMEGIQVRL
jgi:hypothetical protein